MGKKRRHSTPEFKASAVKLVTEQEYQVSAIRGVPQPRRECEYFRGSEITKLPF